MSAADHRVSVVYRCGSGHEHELCVPIQRGVPKELRCAEGQSQGFGSGGGGMCRVPADMQDQVDRALRDNFHESKRQGFVVVSD